MNYKIIVQLVLYKDARFLPGLLDSLRAQTFTNFFVLALDNGGGDETGQAFKELWPGGELVYSADNIGFSGGHNLLLKRSLSLGAPFLVILNTDVVLHPNFLRELYDSLTRNPDIDAVGPVILKGVERKTADKAKSSIKVRDLTPVSNTLKKEKTLIQCDYLPFFGEGHLVNDCTKFCTNEIQNYRLNMNFRYASKHSPDSGRKVQSIDELPRSASVDYLSGAALMLRSSVLEKKGLWDSRLFLYGEERDLFYRLLYDGHSSIVIRNAVCWHFHNGWQGSAESHQREYYYLRRNKVLYFKKYKLAAGLTRFIIMEIIKLPVTFFWTLRRGGVRMFYLYFVGIWHGLLGKTGKYINLKH